MIFPESKFLPRVVYDPLSLTFAGLGLAGSGMSAAGTLMGGAASSSALRAQAPADILAANYAAQKSEWDAQESRAAAQRKAIEDGQRTNLVLSKLQAGAAAGGGSVADVGDLGGQIVEKGDYQKLMDMYAGEERARGLEDQAKALRTTGMNRAMSDIYKADVTDATAPLSAAGTLMSGVSGLFDKYGKGLKFSTG